jgi:hypothetical protein
VKLAFAHHQDVLHRTDGRKPGAVGIHSAAENIALHLREQADGFDYLAPLHNRCTLPAAVRIALPPKSGGKKYYGWAEPSLSRSYGRQLARKLSKSDASVVLCTEVKHAAFLATDRPVALWTDSLYGGLFDYYETFSHLCRRTIRDLQAMDRAAVANCAVLIFASDWAAQRAVELYGAKPEQVRTVPYGANFTSGLSREEAAVLTAQKPFDGICRLLFTGVEWRRKGGDTAVRIAEQLNAQGIRTELTFLGTDPARHMERVPDFVKSAGFLSPSKPDELQRMKQLYRDAHFLLQPCRAECFGHIFPEANSFALPAIASNAGGIPTAVHEGVNGYCFDPEDATGFTECIGRLFSQPDIWRDLAMKAFDDYRARLSWERAAARTADILSKEK